MALMAISMQKGRPTHLSLSPSDGALGGNAKDITVEQERGEEDRAVLSDVSCPLCDTNCGC